MPMNTRSQRPGPRPQAGPDLLPVSESPLLGTYTNGVGHTRCGRCGVSALCSFHVSDSPLRDTHTEGYKTAVSVDLQGSGRPTGTPAVTWAHKMTAQPATYYRQPRCPGSSATSLDVLARLHPRGTLVSPAGHLWDCHTPSPREASRQGGTSV